MGHGLVSAAICAKYSQTAVHEVFLGHDDRSGLSRGTLDRFTIQRFDGMEIDHPDGYILGIQRLRRTDRLRGHQPRGEDSDIGPGQ